MKTQPLVSSQLPALGKRVDLQLPGVSASAVALAHLATQCEHLLVLICPDSRRAEQLHQALSVIYSGDALLYPHWENLPYDNFSPHANIVSDRMLALLATRKPGPRILITTIPTVLLRLAPMADFLGRCFQLSVGQHLGFAELRQHLIDAGYSKVSQVNDPGDFSLRGSLIDFFPMAAQAPIRIDFLDDEIASIRSFDPETQQSIASLEQLTLVPASEIPDDSASIARFSASWNRCFAGHTRETALYQDVRKGMRPGGIEYYLPLFYESTSNFFDYLHPNTLLVLDQDCVGASNRYWQEIQTRYDNLCGDISRPILEPHQVFMRTEELFARIKPFARFQINKQHDDPRFIPLPKLDIDHTATNPLAQLIEFVEGCRLPIVLGCTTRGRQAVIEDVLKDNGLRFTSCQQWQEWDQQPPGLYTLPLPLPDSCHLDAHWVLLSENAIYGDNIAPQISREQNTNQAGLIRNLVELIPGCLVVHSMYGLGKYLGLENELLDDGTAMEFMALEYADQSRLLVPVTELHYISRYQGAGEDAVQLDRLGSSAWEKKVDKAEKRARDTAAELLDIYANRANQKHAICSEPSKDYHRFCAEFTFVETPDQHQAIEAVIADMCANKSMDRLVCGDVGFGKTEVAMRASFLAVENGSQVAVLCPTTLLAQQHYNNFVERFASWPIKIGVISRFQTAKEVREICAGLEQKRIDILIGTHALLTHKQHFANLGLSIIDEEHRFGVMQKEQLKELRSSMNILTLTATPIPRTLNFSLNGLRDLSIIATAPSNRLAIQTLVMQERDHIIREAVLRELLRGGQVFVIYNQVRSIHQYTERLSKLIPEARVDMAHGQMHERELERVMTRFYHQQFNVLVCSTIIENGIDIPSANTIIVLRADKFGLAQLHQLRGRVGRSHHQAYAYMFVPETITDDARARLTALANAKTLGAGFSLAMHDLEIRGAGELLGHEQSGDIAKVGFTLYLSMLERAIHQMKHGSPPADTSQCEVDVHCSAIIPHDYIADVETRLQLYKRIANTNHTSELAVLKSEMVDRFGTLPQETENLLQVTRLRHKVSAIGVKKIQANASTVRIVFVQKPRINIEALMQLIQEKPKQYKLLRGDTLIVHQPTQKPGERVAIIQDICTAIAMPKATACA